MDKSKLQTTLISGKKGNQDIHTQWNSTNNNIDNFNFTDTLPLEIYLKYERLHKKIFSPDIILTYNWMESRTTNIILEWEFLFNE